MTKHIGVYPGTFDPITNGHLDIIARASKLVDKLVIGVAINEDKHPLFSLDERLEMVRTEAASAAGTTSAGFWRASFFIREARSDIASASNPVPTLPL